MLGGHPGEQLEVRGPRRPAQHGHAAPRPAGPTSSSRSTAPSSRTAVGAGRDREPHGRAQPRRWCWIRATGRSWRWRPARLRQQRRYDLTPKQFARDTHNMASSTRTSPARPPVVTMGAALTAGIDAADAVPHPVRDQGGDRIVHDDAPPDQTFSRPDPGRRTWARSRSPSGTQPLYDWIRRWGFGRPTHIGLPAEATRHPAARHGTPLVGNIPTARGSGHAAADGGHVLGHRQRRRDGRAARG